MTLEVSLKNVLTAQANPKVQLFMDAGSLTKSWLWDGN
jgi:hypothetical protein